MCLANAKILSLICGYDGNANSSLLEQSDQQRGGLGGFGSVRCLEHCRQGHYSGADIPFTVLFSAPNNFFDQEINKLFPPI